MSKTREDAEMHMVLIEKLKDLNYYNKFIGAIQKYEAAVSREETIVEVVEKLLTLTYNGDERPARVLAEMLLMKLREGKK